MTYDEWFEKVGASLWRDAEIPTADILRAAWVSATIAEREACAKACEERAAYYNEGDEDGPESRRGDGAMACARTIRARGNSTITVA